MDEGTIFIVLIFPRPWPPREDRQLLSQHEGVTSITLSGDQLGRLVFSVGGTGEGDRSFRFQPITIEGGGRALLTLRWSKNQVSLWLNGQDVRLERDAPGEEFVLKTPEDPTPAGPSLGDLNLDAAKSEAEEIFLYTLVDIDRKVAEHTRPSVIKAAGLLRQLLLDQTPLVQHVNRTYRKNIEFEVIDYRSPPPLSPQAHWRNLDSSRFPGAQTIRVNLEGLLRAPCLEWEGTTATVRDVIKACANVRGGVHLGRARTYEEQALIDWDRAFTLIGEEPSLRAIAGLCRVVLRGLEPLVREIVRSA